MVAHFETKEDILSQLIVASNIKKLVKKASLLSMKAQRARAESFHHGCANIFVAVSDMWTIEAEPINLRS